MGKGTLHCTHDIVHLRGLWQMIAIRVGRSQGVHQPENTGAVYMGINWTMFGGISAINERVLNVWMKMSYKRQSSPWDAWAASKICTVTIIHCHLTATSGAKGASSYQRVSTNCVSGYLRCAGHVSRGKWCNEMKEYQQAVESVNCMNSALERGTWNCHHLTDWTPTSAIGKKPLYKTQTMA